MPDEKNSNLLATYQQLCESYRAIDDFRTKLLGFLPLVSGAGIFFLLNDAFTDQTKINSAKGFLVPIGTFGFVITLGLFFYELHGIRKCSHLINVGKKIEDLMGIEGQFTNRPGRVTLFTAKLFINEPITARIIYPAVLAAWAFVALLFALPKGVPWVAILVLIVGFYIPSRLNLKG